MAIEWQPEWVVPSLAQVRGLRLVAYGDTKRTGTRATPSGSGAPSLLVDVAVLLGVLVGFVGLASSHLGERATGALGALITGRDSVVGGLRPDRVTLGGVADVLDVGLKNLGRPARRRGRQ